MSILKLRHTSTPPQPTIKQLYSRTDTDTHTHTYTHTHIKQGEFDDDDQDEEEEKLYVHARRLRNKAPAALDWVIDCFGLACDTRDQVCVCV